MNINQNGTGEIAATHGQEAETNAATVKKNSSWKENGGQKGRRQTAHDVVHQYKKLNEDVSDEAGGSLRYAKREIFNKY